MANISIRKDESGFFWIVRYACCDTPQTKLHEWQVARRIAFGHKCPPPFPMSGVRPSQPEGLTNGHGTIRAQEKRSPGAVLARSGFNGGSDRHDCKES